MNRLTLFLLLPFFVLCGALIGAHSANAASEYDNSLVVVEEPFKFRGGTTTAFDFGQWIATNSFSACQPEINLFKDMISSGTGYYWITQMTYASYPNEQSFFINWTGNKTEPIDTSWSSSSLQFGRYPNAFNQIQIDVGPSYTNPYCRTENNFTFSNTERTFQWYRAVETNYNIDYPEGYEGDVIEPVAPPAETIETAPNWYISNILDNKGKFHDSNFNTFDGNPFLCEGDLAPVLYYEIFRKSEIGDILITSGYQSATAEINYDFGSADGDRDYEIVGWYDCGDGTIFPNQGRALFTINRSGMLVKDLFESCVDENFPFIHVEGCLSNMYTTINLLVFGEVQFPNWSFNPACHTLNTMDDWLSLPNNYTVCPQIPNNVRAIVTPFVAFMLGLVTMKFLHRRTGDFNG